MRHSNLLIAIIALLFLGSCERENVLEELDPSYRISSHAIGEAPLVAAFYDGVWQLQLAEDFDPLFRIIKKGESVRFETDPTITSWGTDYWGYWSDPYTLDGDHVSYTVGLTHTTYTFARTLKGIKVSKRLVVTPYLGGGDPTVTLTEVGIFAHQ